MLPEHVGVANIETTIVSPLGDGCIHPSGNPVERLVGVVWGRGYYKGAMTG